MNELKPDTVESSELVEQTFTFWFSDNGHIRSPFPEYIRAELKQKATEKFFKWAAQLTDETEKVVNEAIVGEKFEEFIFEIALQLVKTDDERITVNYPFLPRIGDPIDGDVRHPGRNVITDRIMLREGDDVFMKLKARSETTGEVWDTRFQLPG